MIGPHPLAERVLHALPDAAIATAFGGRIHWWNPQASALLGWRADEVLGRRYSQVVRSRLTRAEEAGVRRCLATGQVWRGELTLLRRDRSELMVDVTCSPLRDDGDMWIGTLCTLRPVSSLMVGERMAQHAQRVDAVGRLVAGVSHDFNNLLGVILGSLDAVLETSAALDADRECLELARTATLQAADITRQLLSLSAVRPARPRVLEVRRALQQLHPLLRRVAREQITVELSVTATSAYIICDPTLFDQVMLNLVVNARDAMPHGGTITIDVQQRHADTPTRGVWADGVVCIAVRDTGSGIPERIRPFIFDPFFSTKSGGAGTGLGLAIVRDVVDQVGGAITVESTEGIGSVFTLSIPLTHERPAQKTPVTSVAAVPEASATILLAEDDELLRTLLAGQLRRHGFRVVACADGLQAIDLARRFRGSIDLLLTDIRLPGMDGRALADAIRVVRPEVQLLFMTGNAPEETAAHLLAAGHAPLQKPFDQGTLLAAVTDALARPARP